MPRIVSFTEYNERLSRVLTDESQGSDAASQDGSLKRTATERDVLDLHENSETEEERPKSIHAKVRKLETPKAPRGDTREVRIYGQDRDSLKMQAFAEELGLNAIVRGRFGVIALGPILKLFLEENKNI